MMQYPSSTRMIPTSLLLTPQWPQPQSEELLLAIEESDFEDKKRRRDFPKMEKECNEIRKINSNQIVIGKTMVDNDKEDFDNAADADNADNAVRVRRR